MDTLNFLNSTLSLLFLIIISSFTYLFSKKIKFPYTVLLVFVGIILFPLSKIYFFSFIDDFSLSPNILFYVLLPILLFEASYNINIRDFFKSWKTISLLAISGVLISVFFIGATLYYIFDFAGFHIPFLVSLLFGSIISATDPVAVISIFKSVGAPKRLTLIFEGESLFNDGTAVSIFTVILLIIVSGEKIGTGMIFYGICSFFSMIIGGILFGLLLGFIFSKILGKINYNEEAEISLSLISCYVTFVLAEIINHKLGLFHISPIIGTVVSSMVLGNYGKYKITPKSESYMNKFLEFFTFLANSIVFILMGIIFFSIDINISSLIIPVMITIIIVMLARAISVYASVNLINKYKLEKNIPDQWQKLLFWGGLRGVLALIMVLIIPGPGSKGYLSILHFQNMVGWNYGYDIKEFLLVLTIGVIIFTTFVNTPTISIVMKRMGIDKLFNFEKIEYDEWKIMANLNILKKLNKFYKEDYLNKKEYQKLNEKYKNQLLLSSKRLNDKLKGDKKQIELFIKRLVLKYALGIEKNYLERLFYNKKLDEKHFKYIYLEIENKIEQIDSELNGNNNINSLRNTSTWLEKNSLFKINYTNHDMYIISRTKYELAKKVIKDLQKLPNKELGFNEALISNIISMYTYSSDLFYKKRKELLKNDKGIIKLEENILNKYFLQQEEKLLQDFYNIGVIPAKYYNKMIEDIENQLYKNLKVN